MHEDDHPVIAHIINGVFEKNEKHTINFRIKGSGEYIVVKGSFNPVIGKNNEVQYVVIVMRDIHIQNKDVENVVEREQRFKSLFDQNPDFVFSLDLDFVLRILMTRCLMPLDSQETKLWIDLSVR
ncbi:hypothetical protein G3M54_00080 [Bacillus megaterium NBRC 15308 = ATCC 14581]|nr:hypothetical protein [Priestia megaterium NBRC 15308 = ATCC 14581]